MSSNNTSYTCPRYMITDDYMETPEEYRFRQRYGCSVKDFQTVQNINDGIVQPPPEIIMECRIRRELEEEILNNKLKKAEKKKLELKNIISYFYNKR